MDQLTQISGCDSKYFDKKQIQATKAIREYLISHLDEKSSLGTVGKRGALESVGVPSGIFPHIWGHSVCLPQKIQNEFSCPVAFGKQDENR